MIALKKLSFKKYLHLKTLFINISSLSVIQIMNMVFPAVTLPYLVRILGPEKFGLVNFGIAFSTYFLTLSDYGFNLSATKEISINRASKENVSRIFSNVFYTKVILGVISFILFLLILLSFDKFSEEKVLYLLSFGYVIGSVIFPVWYFQGMERMEFLPGFFFFPRLIGTIFIFILVKQPGDYLKLIGIYGGVQVLSGSAAFYFTLVRERVKLIRPSIEGIRQQLSKGYRIFLSNISIGIYTSSATILLGLLAGNTAVGFYVAADKIKNLVSAFLSSVSTGVYPYVNRLLQESRESFLRFNYKLLKLRSLFTLLIAIMIYFLADPIVTIVLGDNFTSSIPVLKILAFIPFIVGLSNSFGIQIMLPLNLENAFLKIVSSAALLNMMLAVYLIVTLNGLGAALSILLTEIFVSGAMLFYLLKHNLYSGMINEV